MCPLLYFYLLFNHAINYFKRIMFEGHFKTILLVINSRSFADQHVSRVKKFVNSFMISQNDKIRFIGQMAMLYSCGPLGRNVTRIGNLDNVILNVDGDLYCNAKAISDLIDVRDGLKYLPELDRDDVELLIEDLCCN